MIIIGGGYVAAEFAHVFSAFGTAVTVVNRVGPAAAQGRTTRSPSASPSCSAGEVDVRLETSVEPGRAGDAGRAASVLHLDGPGGPTEARGRRCC